MTRHRCVDSGDWPASLEVGRVYEGTPDGDMLRVTDEDGESYLYPTALFRLARLADTGSVYVTLAAARTFADQVGAQPEEARRELTEILLDATERKDGSWRSRKRSTGLDVSARVRHESGLAVVAAVNVRDYSPRRGG